MKTQLFNDATVLAKQRHVVLLVFCDIVQNNLPSPTVTDSDNFFQHTVEVDNDSFHFVCIRYLDDAS